MPMELRLNLNLRLRFNCEPASVPNLIPLHLLMPGQSGLVFEIAGEPHLVRRLDEMGLRNGTQVRMVQPGHPCIVAVDHQRFSFRGNDSAMVLVEVAPCA